MPFLFFAVHENNTHNPLLIPAGSRRRLHAAVHLNALAIHDTKCVVPHLKILSTGFRNLNGAADGALRAFILSRITVSQ